MNNKLLKGLSISIRPERNVVVAGLYSQMVNDLILNQLLLSLLVLLLPDHSFA
jgi:hypothetical protein